MKKFLSIVLMVVMLMSAALAVAEGEMVDVVLETLGLGMRTPDVYRTENGFATPLEMGILNRNPYVACVALEFFPLPHETYLQLEARIDNLTEEEIQQVRDLFSVSAQVFVTNGTYEDVKPFLASEPTSAPEEIASANGYTYWYVPTVSDTYLNYFEGEDVEKLKAGYEMELEDVRKEFVGDVKNATFFSPVDNAAGYVGLRLSFTTQDLDGNTVTSQELFADNKVTMVNLWGTWCGNCTGEMSELAELHKRLQEKGCGIVGLENEYDYDASTIAEAKDILASNGVTYPNVILPITDSLLVNVQAYPTTFFVDSEGTILTYPIEGAAVDQYEPTIDKLLGGEEVAPIEGADAAGNDANAYRVIVRDKEGPVKGAVIQFCDEKTCTLGKTDEEGIATFNMPEGVVYDVHVLKVPAGYQKEAETYHTLDKFSDVNIILEKE
ncbi:MAG: TlpA family protein disulfide reductase [Clostridia bacterium]|nr:TlpA family protein disulfide reductase [Clostridia bacterium]